MRVPRVAAPAPHLLLLAVLFFVAGSAAHAQLAQSFYNITGIETRTLSNGVQVTIETDGTVDWAVDRKEFLDLPPGENFGDPLPLTAFRIRFIGARTKVPAYNNIGVYPVDAAVVTLGQDDLTGRPAYSRGRDRSASDHSIPRLDVTIRLFVPVRVTRVNFQYGGWGPWTMDPDRHVSPREVAIEPSPDRRSLVLTFISDRTDAFGVGARMHRSSAATQSHRLQITSAGAVGAPLRVDVLHTSLRDVVAELSRVTGVPLATAADADAQDISLYLPEAPDLAHVLEVLANGYDLAAVPRPEEQGGGFTIGRGGAVLTSEQVPLKYLTPDAARQLLPDFLLPYIHADAEHHALVVSGSPALVQKLRHDLTVLDLPVPQVRVEARVYEIQHAHTATTALRASLEGGYFSFDTAGGAVSLTVQPGRDKATITALEAWLAHVGGRLVARPSLVVASGSPGTLFLGQTRFLTVLQNSWGGQNVTVLPLPVGTSIAVTPTVCDGDENGAGSEILLDVAPQVSTVDSIEPKTGLPTVGTRQVHSTVRLRDNDALIIAGLDTASATATRRSLPPLSRLPWIGSLFRSRSANASDTELAVVVTAHRLGADSPAANRSPL